MQKASNTQSKYWLFGKYPVLHALRNPKRKVLDMLYTEGGKRFLLEHGIIPEKLSFPSKIVTNEGLQMILPNGAVHQGIAINVHALRSLSLHEYLHITKPKDIILACDHITDPHNFGAIIRNSAAFGAGAMLQCTISGVPESAIVAKAAAGMLEEVSIIEVVNLAESLKQLKENGYWVIGLDGQAQESIEVIHKFDKLVLVLGAEGEGMRKLTSQNCDIIAKIPMMPCTESLNVSNCAAIALYEFYKHHKS